MSATQVYVEQVVDIDALADAVADLPRGESESFYGIEVRRDTQPDPDGWEFEVGGTDMLTNDQVAEAIAVRL